MVRIERNAAVFTVILDRPEVRNAVDGPTALDSNPERSHALSTLAAHS